MLMMLLTDPCFDLLLGLYLFNFIISVVQIMRLKHLVFEGSLSAHRLLPHFFLLSDLFLLLFESLVFSLVEKRSPHFLPTFLNLFQQVKLTHLLHELLILFLLHCYLLFFEFQLPLLLLLSPLISVILFYLLYKQSTFHTSTSTVLSCPVLDQKLTKHKVLLLCCLQFHITLPLTQYLYLPHEMTFNH